jgi:hypothetical protein
MKVQTPFWVKKRNQMGPVKVGFDGKFWENSRADSISFCPCSPLAFALAFVSFVGSQRSLPLQRNTSFW